MHKISRSKIDLYLECQRCFWLEVKKNIKRPQPAPYTINSAIDLLLKKEFDIYRQKGEPHPIMIKFNIDAIPFNHESISSWRNTFSGIQFYHEPTNFLIFGGVDDVWINPQNELLIVDYKATGANQHQIYDSYKRQMEIYQWLFLKNNFNVSSTGYFVFARVNKANGFESDSPVLSFDLFIEKYDGDTSWVENVLFGMKEILELENPPDFNPNCNYCNYCIQNLNV
ncbi:MAG: PD-(D/E)XK nuclease family protein [Patescibacteria group bacterium]|nr:PD-(D/E)XK nuclease family protein [Patescibacteria group bacterium]MCX7589528.1 PD-(D/E)XK nuclease family protein [Patescibacteria group bacterium]MDW8279950.1 PD-(D/E)XK nuclease family protein [bacterium]